MFFLNFTAGEFVALLGTLGALVTALYLLDRSRQRRLVSTLTFWNVGAAAESRKARPKVRQPWSLFLQLLSLLLLLLAIAQIQWGSREGRGRDHVLLVDTSSWSAERLAPRRTLLDEEKSLLRRYVNGLSRNDRVMLIAADALATPMMPFTADKARFEAALNGVSPGWSSLSIARALAFAREAQTWPDARKGEIVYAGPALTDEEWTGVSLSGVRLLKVEADRENVGIRGLYVTESYDEADSWQAIIRIKNYGLRTRSIHLRVRYGSTAFAVRNVNLEAGRESSVSYSFIAHAPGDLVAEIQPGDALSTDDRASVHVPGRTAVDIAVFTSRPETLKPLLETAHRLQAHYFAPGQYSPKPPGFDLVLLDNVAVSAPAALPALYLNPPKDHSPLPVKANVEKTELTWASAAQFGSSVQAKKVLLPQAKVFQTFAGDITVGAIPEGSVVVERPANGSHPKLAVAGLDPAAGDQRFQVSTPLLFADLIEWLSPNAFRTFEASAQRVGSAAVTLNRGEEAGGLRVTDDRGLAVPTAVRDNQLQFFVGRPESVHIASGEHDRVVSLSIPDVAERAWTTTPAQLNNGLPAKARVLPRALDLWKWLAALAAMCLIIEWLFWGAPRNPKRLPLAVSKSSEHALDSERELVAK
jgi:hypothetical protein